MNLEFIPAESADIEIIFSMLKELIDAYEDLQSINYEKVLAWCRHQIEEHIDEYTCILADGEKAGWYNFSPSDDGRMELDNFYVLPGYRNRGIGTAALNRCFAQTDKPIFLYCFTKNSRALTLYSRMGFSEIETVGTTRCIMQRNPEV
jgi:N-acetylglutamate synthase-like GNAT family acetyltransferase